MKEGIIIPIRPRFVADIFEGRKTIELRKTAPKIHTPFTAYIYETQGKTEIPWIDEDGHFIFNGRGLVVGQFICEQIELLDYDSIGGGYWKEEGFIYVDPEDDIFDDFFSASQISRKELMQYTKGKRPYGLFISDVGKYERPIDISAFGLKRPPQSWCYVKEAKANERKTRTQTPL